MRENGIKCRMKGKNRMKQGIIFDMDGTLWNSAEGVAKAWSGVLAREDSKRRAITADEVQSVMGMTMDAIAKTLFPELDGSEQMKLLDICCEEENRYLRIHGGTLYEGMIETIQILARRYPLYIVSNCQSGYIEAFLDHYDLAPYFRDIECYGNNGEKKGANIRNVKERNHLTRAVYIGDIQGDYDASVEAGVDFIHAAYGFGNIDREVPAIHAITELPEMLEEWSGAQRSPQSSSPV